MKEAKWIAASNALEPFWTQLHKIFIYPFSLHPLILIFSLAVLNMLFYSPTLASGLMRLALWGVLYKYAFAVLKATAIGNFIPPPLGLQSLSDDFGEAFRQVFIFIIVGVFFVLILQFAGFPIAIVYLIAAMLALPIMIIIYVATGSVIHAVNPVTVVSIIARIGWPYLLVYAFILLLGGAPNAVVWATIKVLPISVVQFVFFLANSFYTIVTYHLMGYVLLQYHQEIGYKVDYEDFNLGGNAQDTPSAEEKDEFSLQLDPLLKDGKYEDALQLIEDYPEERIAREPVLAGYYFSLLQLTKRDHDMLKHADDYLALLVKGNEKKKALKVYADCFSISQNFLPVPGVLLKLAGWFNEAGDAKNAIKTYNRLIKLYPADDLIPKAYFRAAQIFNDRLMNAKKAQQIFNAILKKYPESDEASLAKNYIKQMG